MLNLKNWCCLENDRIGKIMNGRGKSCHWSKKLLKMYGQKAISNKYVLIFLQKVTVVSEDLIVIGVNFKLLVIKLYRYSL